VRYFLDTEFIERPGSIQLISIGIVSEDGRTFYAETTSFDEREADDWVRENVLNKLRWWTPRGGCILPFNSSDYKDGQIASTRGFGTISFIRDWLLEFFKNDSSPEFWGYFADYDWVVFCWIFGKMIDLPAGFPKYCRDLKQMLDESGKGKIPEPEGEHNALVDAHWNKELYEYLIS
jgi:hypothetical protein